MRPLTDEARKRYISKLYLYPLNDLITLSQSLDDPSAILEKMGYYKMYSGHDSQVANILKQFNPDFHFVYVPYASQLYFELYRGTSDKKMFYVKPTYNGQTLPIIGCNDPSSAPSQPPLLAQNTFDGSIQEVEGYCELQTFIDSLSKVLYVGDEARLKELCYETPALPDPLHHFLFGGKIGMNK